MAAHDINPVKMSEVYKAQRNLVRTSFMKPSSIFSFHSANPFHRKKVILGGKKSSNSLYCLLKSSCSGQMSLLSWVLLVYKSVGILWQPPTVSYIQPGIKDWKLSEERLFQNERKAGKRQGSTFHCDKSKLSSTSVNVSHFQVLSTQ